MKSTICSQRPFEELDRMESQGVISKVTQPIEWVNTMVIVKKSNNKGIRICLDPKGLNHALKCEHYRSKTLEEVTAKLTIAKYFSRFDCRSGFWMIKLNNESSVLTTFNTPFGRYKFSQTSLWSTYPARCLPENCRQGI